MGRATPDQMTSQCKPRTHRRSLLSFIVHDPLLLQTSWRSLQKRNQHHVWSAQEGSIVPLGSCCWVRHDLSSIACHTNGAWLCSSFDNVAHRKEPAIRWIRPWVRFHLKKNLVHVCVISYNMITHSKNIRCSNIRY